MPPKVEAVKAATFTTDDKRAQYARLVVFNHGVASKLISKDKDVNSVSQGDLQKAFKDLTGGTLLAGKDGIELISKLSRKGATDPKVAERGLTTAYAQEVRPFIMRGTLSESFGRRGRKAGEPKPASSGTRKPASQRKPASGRKPAARKPASRKPASRSSRPKPAAVTPSAAEGETPAE